MTGMCNAGRKPSVWLIIVGSLAVQGCAIGGNQGYATVTASYEYARPDRSAREWHAFMNALDRCHIAGYQDAQPARPPLIVCKNSGETGCNLYHATQEYDCIGMGYQTSS